MATSNPKKITIFVPLTKVDVEKRLVYGTFTAESKDKSGEIMDYASSKPLFEAWSAEIHKNSGGKSLGNIREMHKPEAVGKVTDLNFDDAHQVIEGCVKVVDDSAWNKVLEGVYTGFSIGGSYAKRWLDSKNPLLTRYTAGPSEISLVDNPCHPDATFSMIKAQGLGTEAVHFAKSVQAIDGKEKLPEIIAEPEEGDVNVHELSKSLETVPATEAGQEASELQQVWKAKDGTTFSKKAEAIDHNNSLAAEELAKQLAGGALDALSLLEKAVESVEPKVELTEEEKLAKEAEDAETLQAAEALAKKAKEESDKIKYADSGMQKDGKKRYPIDTEEHIRAAWNYIHKVRNAAKYSTEDLAKVKDAIVAAWKEKIDAEGPPEAMEKAERMESLAKHLCDTGRVASIILELNWLKEQWQMESAMEEDASTLPDDMSKVIDQLCLLLQKQVVEETSEVMSNTEDLLEAQGQEAVDSGDDSSTVLVLQLAAGLRANSLQKSFEAVLPKEHKLPGLLAKAGAKHSKSDASSLKKAHDALSDMTDGMCCGMSKAGARHSKSDMKHIMDAHSSLCALGADCNDAADSTTTADGDMGKVSKGDLSKITAERDALQKVVGEITDKITPLIKRISDLEAQPLPMKAPVTALNKTGDSNLVKLSMTNGDVISKATDLLASMNPEDRNKMLMKMALANGVVRGS